MLPRLMPALLILLATLPLGRSTPAQAGEGVSEKPATRTDRYGDPLPHGVVARLGTVRFRQPFADCLAYSPDGKVLASGGGTTIHFWDPTGGKELGRLNGHQAGVHAIAFSSDGSLLASTSYDQTVRLWDVAARRELRVLKGHRGSVDAIAFSPDRQHVASASADGTARIWKVATGEVVQCLGPEVLGGTIYALAYSPDGKLLATGGTDKLVHFWNTDTWKELKTLRGHEGSLYSLRFSADGRAIVSCAADGTVRLWDIAAAKQQWSAVEPDYARCLAVSLDGKTVATGNVSGTLTIREASSGRELLRWKADRACLLSLAYSPDGKALASAVLLSEIRLWDPATGKRVNPTTEPIGSVTRVAFSPDGQRLAAIVQARTDASFHLWDTESWKEQERIDKPGERMQDIAFSPDGATLALSQSVPARIRYLDAHTGRTRRLTPGWGGWIKSIAYSPGGDVLASGHDHGLMMSDAATGKERWRVKTSNQILKVAYSSDSRLLATLSNGNVLRLWDAASREMIREWKPSASLGSFVSFSRDDRSLATAGGATTPGERSPEVCLWETFTGALRFRFRAHRGGVLAVSFSPDGRFLATGGIDDEESVRLWDVATGRQVRSLKARQGQINALAFSADGKVLASGGADSTVLIWRMDALPLERQGPIPDLTVEQMNRLWADLASKDAERAYQAIATLADHPLQSALFLRDALRRSPGVDKKQLAQLISDLDADDFKVREQASRRLADLGRLAVPALKEAIRSERSPEVRRRAQQLLKEQNDRDLPVRTLRCLRSIEVLERIAIQPAREALQTVAEQEIDPLLEREAKASLRRLKRRAPLP